MARLLRPVESQAAHSDGISESVSWKLGLVPGFRLQVRRGVSHAAEPYRVASRASVLSSICLRNIFALCVGCDIQKGTCSLAAYHYLSMKVVCVAAAHRCVCHIKGIL